MFVELFTTAEGKVDKRARAADIAFGIAFKKRFDPSRLTPRIFSSKFRIDKLWPRWL